MQHLDLKKLNFPKAPKDTRVVVAMSGGVDSSVVASLMKEAGFDVVGITLQLYDPGMAVDKKNACCAGQDIYDAAQVAERMGFPHYVLDYESRFRQSVIDDFADTYMRGETPIPCIRCNQTVKFDDLLKTAKELGAEALITGHYVKRLQGPEEVEMHQAVDAKKDQSYFLFATTSEQLTYTRFPLGDFPKELTRAHAERLGLLVADKPDSQDICFVPSGNYANLVKKLRPESQEPGKIIHIDGTEMGQHEGIIHFTVGQRKGLGIGGRHNDTQPLYVIRIDPQTKTVFVGPREALAQQEIFLKNVNWLAPSLREKAETIGVRGAVKIRSAHTPIPATFKLLADKTATVHIDRPEYGISAGQACVLYMGERVLGGGWISHQD